MEGYLKASDTISGQEGHAQINLNGEIHKLFDIKSIEATVEKNKAEVKTIGHRGTQSKTTGWSGTGSMTLYYASSLFRKLTVDYIKTGKDFYFDMIVTNEDPSSDLGKQTVALYGCNIDSVVLAKLDVESDALDEDLDFTFDDVDILDEFNKPSYIK
ncbi:phage tail tube protein [Clostridium paraputrificum]|uniref:phage tail tube protein n=1 Tax=Clostridium paraputrificum TaxID=29363 RepID=UPI003D341566